MVKDSELWKGGWLGTLLESMLAHVLAKEMATLWGLK
jgi:hypothetical protein